MAPQRILRFLTIPTLLTLAASSSADTGSRASFVYVANDTDDSISIYSVDPETGRLAHEGYQAAPSGETGPTACAVHPAGGYLYVTNAGSANVSIYAIDATNGLLTALSPVTVGTGPHELAFDANGDYLYVTSSGSDTVTAFSVDAGSGALTQVGAPVATGTGPGSVAIDPLGRFAWVVNEGSLDISVYDVDGVTGALTASIGAVNIGGAPSDVLVDEDGSHVYVPVANFDLLVTYNVDGVTGNLSILNTRPTGDQPGSLSLQPGGSAIYLVNEGDGDLIGFTVDTGTGVATRIPGSFATGAGPAAVVFDPSGLGAYVTNGGSRDVSCYGVNGITKEPIVGRTMRARNAPSGIALRGAGALTKQGRFLYALNAGADTISGYTIDPASGALTSVGADVATGAGAVALVADPRGRFLYTIEATADQITTYTIDSGTGVLTASLTTVALAGLPRDAAVEASGRFLFVALDNLDLVVRYAIDQATGVPSTPVTRGIGADVQTISIDPTGQFVYVTRATGNVEGFALDNGTPVGANFDEPAPGDPQELRFSPTGERAYGTLRANNLAIPFNIDASTGFADLVPPGNASPTEPNRVVVHPSGAFAYAAILDTAGTGRVDAYTINDLNGNLVDLTTVPAGTNPRDLSLDPSGRWLYVSSEGSDNVTLLSVDPDTGTPSSVGTTAAGSMPSELVMVASFLTPTPPDCNTNGMPDAIDISMGTSLDCNANCIPDECETPDCNTNGVPDECDLAFGPSEDCDANGIPDECDIAGGVPDCNTNGVPDDCDISSGTSLDCNSNGIPDECDPDCNSDGTPDDCEVFLDCNTNGILDECDIALGTSMDVDLNGIPDECECGSATNYCVTSPHTAGPGGVMAIQGTLDIPTNNLALVANACPPQKFGIFFYGDNQVQLAFGEGFRCVGGMTQRINPAVMTNTAGTATRQLDLTAFPFTGGGNTITAGSTWNFQFWFRDPNGGPPDAGFNLTDGISLTFCP